MLSSIETVFNRIWRVKETYVQAWLALYVTGPFISLGPIILGRWILSSTVASMNILSNNFAGYQLNGSLILWLFPFLPTIAIFFHFYWTIPNRSVLFLTTIIVARLFGATVFEILKNFFLAVDYEYFTSYEICVWCIRCRLDFLWIYLSWNIILLGGSQLYPDRFSFR